MEFDIPILIALTIALTEVVKFTGINTRVIPVVSIIVGVALSFIADVGALNDILLNGLLIGAIASGFYDVGKKTLLGK